MSAAASLLIAAAFASHASLAMASCVSELNCSLNGMCVSGVCACDAGWRGVNCEQLNLAPIDPTDGINAWANGTSSWGGVAVADPHQSDLYHFFYSRFVNGCGLLCWVNASECVRATGPTPAGPFVDAEVVIPVFCHNPNVRRAPDGTYVHFHIGSPTPDPHRAPACSSPSYTCASNWPPALPTDGRAFLTLASAPLPTGPWTPLGRAAFTGVGRGWLGWVSNPSVHFFPNGSALLAFRSKAMGGAHAGEELIGLASAPHWSGPYSLLVDAPIVQAHEDPHVWVDARGNLHLLSHGATNHWFTSPNALDAWTLAAGPAYDFTIPWKNGTVARALRRERPQLFFSDDGKMTPLVFTTGATLAGAPSPDLSLTLAQRVLP